MAYELERRSTRATCARERLGRERALLLEREQQLRLRQSAVAGVGQRGHDHDIADYEIYLWEVGSPPEKAARLTWHSGNDRWPDIFIPSAVAAAAPEEKPVAEKAEPAADEPVAKKAAPKAKKTAAKAKRKRR